MFGGSKIEITNNSKSSTNWLNIILAVVAVLILLYLIGSYYNQKSGSNNGGGGNKEKFDNLDGLDQNDSVISDVSNTESIKSFNNDTYGNNNETIGLNKDNEDIKPNNNKRFSNLIADINKKKYCEQYPKDQYPKDTLTAAELLPSDPNSKWAQVNPSGQGELGDQNFLEAGFHIGTNTVGQTLRNPNLQLRSEPPNPQTKVSPWMQTTIEPDINRRALEISSDC